MATRTISTLADGFAGELLGPGDPGYDDARKVWNGAIDRRPALIARCAGVPDVVAALGHARERDLLVAVRGGGHGVAGQAVCDGGIVIDLSPMRGIAVDPRARTARAQGGVLWGELDAATQEHGLATVGGIVTHTGIAGLTLGGGIGWLMRRHGATVDNLLAAEVVTARGDVLRASADEHPDLFWGLRGGGGNFGVVTSFEYRLHEVGPIVLSGPLLYALEDGPEVLRFYRELIAEAPDELTIFVNLRRAPALPFVPAELHGRLVVMAIVCYAGAVERGEQVLAPLRGFGRSLVDAIAPRPYVELQELFNPGVPHGWHYYWKSWELPPLSDGAIDALVEHAARITSPRSYVLVFQLGGALGRVGEHETAYGQRDAAHNVNISAVWLPDDPAGDEHVRWVRECYAALEPYATGRVYVNFLADEGQERVRAAYGEERYARLVALKRDYDPDNVLRLNQNIDPGGLDSGA
jgi:hypothetical protein